MNICLIVQPIHPAGIERLGNAGIEVRHASGKPADLFDEIADVDAVITRSAGLNAAAMDRAPRLKVVGSHGAGVDGVAIAHATRLGIAVVNTPGSNSTGVAEHTIALMLGLAKQVLAADAATRSGDFSFKYAANLSDLTGKTLGVIGYGAIGRKVAEIAHKAFRMQVMVHGAGNDAIAAKSDGHRASDSLETLLTQSDFVTLHCPLTLETKGMIGARELSMMKDTAFLINAARGGLVEENALVLALQTGQLAGAGLDVFESETMTPTAPILNAPNLLLTPHSAGSTKDALRRTAEAVSENVIRVLNGEAKGLVNPEVWAVRRT